MTIAISFDPTDASDVEYIHTLLSVPEADEAPAAAAPKKSRAKAAPAEEPEDEPADEGGATLEQAVEKAQEFVAEGRSAEVKGALATFNVKRVSELSGDQFGEFLALLDEDSVV